MPIPTAVSLAAGIVILVSLQRQLRHGASSKTGEWRLTDQGHLYYRHGDQGLVRYRVSAANISSCCIILRLQDQGQRRTRLLIMRDAVEPVQFRELCARITQHRIPVPDAGQG